MRAQKQVASALGGCEPDVLPKMTTVVFCFRFEQPRGFFSKCLYLGKELLVFLVRQPCEFLLSFGRLFGITKTPALCPSPFSRFIMVFTALCRSTGGSSSVLMTADPDVTDEWWRSTEDQNLGWKRIAPDFYTLNKSYPNNPSSINDRLLHLYIDSQKNPLNDWSIAPRNPPRTNHISGET